MYAKLYKKNYASLRDRIPFEKLPPVFRHAIQIAARCKIEYIWIDALCIVQDSKEDWTRISAQMGSIYLYAVCNIAATGFTDGSRGLFSTRQPWSLFPFMVEIPEDIQLVGHPGFSTPAVKRGKHLLVDYQLWKDGVDEAPLNQRGWVVQERYLSIRTIHFSSNQLFWECMEQGACEIFPQELPSLVSTWNPKGLGSLCSSADTDDQSRSLFASGRGKKRRARFGTTGDMPEFQRLWQNVVHIYSDCALTYTDDKLIAVAGIARYLKAKLGNEYFAGLWGTDLLHQLLWRAWRPGPRPHESKVRGPSWSWASVDGPVDCPEWTLNPRMSKTTLLHELVNVRTSPVDGDAFGRIRDGVLTLAGPLGVLKLPDRDEEVPQTEETRVKGVFLFWDTQEVAQGFGHQAPVSRGRSGTPVWKYKTYHHNVDDMDGSDVFYLPLRIMDENYPFNAIEMGGLLLLPTRMSKGQYKRIGKFEVTYAQDKIDVLKKSTFFGYDSPFFQARRDRNQFVISIV